MIRKIFLALLCSLFPLVTSCATVNKSENFVYITSVHDGDTFSHKNIKYRLYGVDTPEMSKAPFWKPTKGIENLYALKATNFVSKLILHHFVSMQLIGPKTYDRVVAKIKINNQDLSTLLARRGLARVAYIDIKNKNSIYYTKNKLYYWKLIKAQAEAKKNMVGFWGEKGKFNKIFPKAKKHHLFYK